MATTSTIGSPGVEVREFDDSIRVETSTATTLFIPGFAAQGPVEEVININSMEDFVNVYGEPTNAAERYFFYTVKSVLDNSGAGTTVMTSRLPYGAGKGDTVSTAYTLLAYPSIPVVRNPKSVHGYDYYELQPTTGKVDKALNDLLTLFLVKSTDGLVEQPKDNIQPVSVSYDITSSFRDVVDVEKIMLHTITSSVDSTGVTTRRIHYSYDGIVETDVELPSVVVSATWTKRPDAQAHETVLSLTAVLDDKSGNVEANHLATLSIEAVYNDPNLYTIDGLYDFQRLSAQSAMEFPMSTKLQLKYVKAFMEAATYDGQVYKTHEEQQREMKNIEMDKTLYVQKNVTFPDNNQTFQMVFAKDVTYVVGSPVTFQVSLSEYYNIISGEKFNWSNSRHAFTNTDTVAMKTEELIKYEALEHAAFIMLNTARSTINDKFEGYYLGLTDNMFISPSDDYIYNAIQNVKITSNTTASLGQSIDIEIENGHKGLFDNAEGTGNFDILSTARLGFPVDGNISGSMSMIIERNCTTMDISTTEYDDTLSMCLFKLNKSTTDTQTLKLSYTMRERFNGALGKTRLKSTSKATTPVSYFLENIISDGSNNVAILINPYISKTVAVDIDGVLRGKVRVYGDKLKVNLDNYEQKYTVKNLQKKIDGGKANPTTTAKTYLEAYEKMIKQAGVSPAFLDSIADGDAYEMFQPCDSIYPIGTYSTVTNTTKIIGNLPYKLERALELMENDEEYPDCDIVVDGGLTTIYAYSNGAEIIGDSTELVTALEENHGDNELNEDEDSTLNKQTQFNDTLILKGIEDMRTGRSALSNEANAVIEDWKSVENVFLKFCNSQANGGRGDCFFVGDILRGIVVKGKNTKVQTTFGTKLLNSSYGDTEEVNNSWSTSVYYPIKHLTDGVVSSYAGLFAQWFKVDDAYSGQKVWLPASGYVAALMAATDLTYGPWYASAGLNRGVVQGVIDYALNPKQKERTDLYKLCINSIPKMPQTGVTVFGIRTMSKKESVFDQIPCRRTFLYIEKYLKRFLKFYLFEPNTSYTRLAIYNEIEPFMESLKSQNAIYSYKLVIDTTNNTPEIINNGDLAVDVSAAPVRTAENIILNARASKYTNEATVTSNV